MRSARNTARDLGSEWQWQVEKKFISDCTSHQSSCSNYDLAMYVCRLTVSLLMASGFLETFRLQRNTRFCVSTLSTASPKGPF